MRGALLSLGAAVVAVVAAQAAPVSVDEILSNPDRFDGQMVTIEGTMIDLKQRVTRPWKPTVPIRCRDGGGNVCQDQARPALAQSLTSRSPFPREIVGAKAKDAVENALHAEVCAGTLTLKAAQTIIAADCKLVGREDKR